MKKPSSEESFIGSNQVSTSYTLNGIESLKGLSEITGISYDLGDVIMYLYHIKVSEKSFMFIPVCKHIYMHENIAYSFICRNDYFIELGGKYKIDATDTKTMLLFTKALIATVHNLEGYGSCYLQEVLRVENVEFTHLQVSYKSLLELAVKFFQKTNPLD